MGKNKNTIEVGQTIPWSRPLLARRGITCATRAGPDWVLAQDFQGRGETAQREGGYGARDGTHTTNSRAQVKVVEGGHHS